MDEKEEERRRKRADEKTFLNERMRILRSHIHEIDFRKKLSIKSMIERQLHAQFHESLRRFKKAGCKRLRLLSMREVNFCLLLNILQLCRIQY